MRSVTPIRHASRFSAMAILALAGLALPAVAQDEPPPPILPTIPVDTTVDGVRRSTALSRLLDAGYLNDDERAAIRIRHGLWNDDDIADPVAMAIAAASAGAFESDALDHANVPSALAAEALLRRGHPELALERAAGDISARAARIRVEALEQLGRFDEAIEEANAFATRATDEAFNGDEIAELVRSLMIRRRLAGPDREGGRDDAALLDLLRQARENIDPLSWLVRVVEAELLFERHSYEDAGQAVQEALALHPKSADAYALLGRMAVNSFNLDGAKQLAEKLDELASSFASASVEADLLRIAAALRQDSAAAAVDISRSLLGRLPTHRRAIAWTAASEAAAFHDNATRDLLDRLDVFAPGSSLGYAVVGSVLSEQRQYDDARRYLEEATRRQPNWAEPWADLGLLEIQAGRDASAETALQAALALDAFDERAKNSLALVEGLAAWGMTESEHFRVRYRPGIDQQLAEEMLPILETLYIRVTAGEGGFDHEPSVKTLIELMPSHRWFSVRISGMTRIHTMAASTGPVIAMESPREGRGMTRGPYDWPRVLQHEFAHTVTLSRTKNRIPHWFTEAAAVYVEDAPRDHSTWELLHRAFATETLFDLDAINIAFVRPKKPADRGQAYAQGHWMYEFIAERFGARAPLNLMDRYAAGEDEAAAFAEELGMDRDAFMATFTGWAEAQLRDAGLLPNLGTPTLDDYVESGKFDAEQEGEPFDLTLELAHTWLDEEPEHPQLLGLVVDLELEQLGEPEDRPAILPEPMVELLKRAESARPTDDRPRRLLARHYLAIDDAASRARAIPRLAYLDAREQNSPAFAQRLALFYAELGAFDSAVSKAERAVNISPFDADLRELAARVALIASDQATAFRHLEALVELEPDRAIHQRRLDALRARTSP